MQITVPVRLTDEDIKAFACEHYEKKVRSDDFLKISENDFIKNVLDNFHKDYNSQLLHTYILSVEGISNESKIEKSILQWEKIHHLEEYPSCFVIEISSIRKNIIPRRCFETEQQLRDFRSIVSSNLPASKWSLKGIPLGHSRSDEKADEFIDDEVPFPDQNDCLYSITFQANEKEAQNLSFTMLRNSSYFKKFVAFFFFLYGFLIWIFSADPVYLGVAIFAGAVVIFQVFFKFQKASLKLIRDDKTFWQEVTMSFFSDRLVCVSDGGQAEYFWNTIFRIKMSRSGLLIYFHPESATVIPVRVINTMIHKDEFLYFIKSREIADSKQK